jgi:hypothetical protein
LDGGIAHGIGDCCLGRPLLQRARGLDPIDNRRDIFERQANARRTLRGCAS